MKPVSVLVSSPCTYVWLWSLNRFETETNVEAQLLHLAFFKNLNWATAAKRLKEEGLFQDNWLGIFYLYLLLSLSFIFIIFYLYHLLFLLSFIFIFFYLYLLFLLSFIFIIFYFYYLLSLSSFNFIFFYLYRKDTTYCDISPIILLEIIDWFYILLLLSLLR